MTVVLVGVGADTDHVRPALELTADGKFDYIPIPETHPSTEPATYGTWDLPHRDTTAAEYVTKIAPHGDGEWITDSNAIADHQLHHDPNFTAHTYGDRRGGGGKGATLAKHLETRDVLGFYTGIKAGPEDPHLNRYLYGYMTVRGVHDFSDLDGEAYHAALRNFPENAHTKRLEGAGAPKHDDIVIVDGTESSELLTRPSCISERIDQPPWYQVTTGFANDFNLLSGRKGICRKFPFGLDLSGDTFIEKVRSRVIAT